MISRDRALEILRAHLAKKESWPHSETAPPFHIQRVKKIPHAGWLIHYDRSDLDPHAEPHAVGWNGGHLVVDGVDGSLHYVNAVWWTDEGWTDEYLMHVHGHRSPDRLAAAVRALDAADGAVAALAHLRRVAPRLLLHQARAYLTAVRDGSEPPDELYELTRPLPLPTPAHIETVAGPAV
ncbi:YrhB domain-containing protein [Kitasatospora sp. NPDC001664]